MKKRKDMAFHLSTVLTAIASFLMGFIDAYTFLQQSEAFVSAQTGNMVSLSVKIFSGQWNEAMGHLWAFGGFAIGAFAGEAVLEHSSKKGLKKYRFYLLIQTILLLFLALFQFQVTAAVMLFILGALAGYELTVFRKFRASSINNGIMTGNMKNLMHHLYHFLFNRKSEAKSQFADLAFIIIVFMLGAGMSTLIIQVNPDYILWIAFVFSLLTYTWTTNYLAEFLPQKTDFPD